MINMKVQNGIFDITSPEELFNSIEQSFKRYQDGRVKSIELLLYIIMGLNHLREWIAPNYNHKEEPQNDGERFYREIYLHDSFKTIQFLCNRTKHLQQTDINTSSSHGLSFHEWPDIDSVNDFDKGPVTNYFVDDKNVIEIIRDVIEFYRNEWFSKKKNRT